jgi:D-alanyl-D-alanine carboxypeptidase
MKDIFNCLFGTLIGLIILLPLTSFSKESLVKNKCKLSDDIQQIVKDRNIPSLDIAISVEGEVCHLNYHHSDLQPQKIYGIGSTTKLLSAILVMHYFEQKKIDIHEKLIKYIDKLDVAHIIGINDITVLQLLRHESGISDYANNPNWLKLIGENNAPITFNEKIKLVNSTLNSPGSFSYSNSNYLLLEKIIENITNLKYQEAFNQYYHRLNLDISLGRPDIKLQAFFATTDKNSNDVSMLKENYGYDGGAYTTPIELLTLFSMLINNSILSQNSMSIMQSWGAISPYEISIGSGNITSYGAGLMRLIFKNKSYIGHMGGTLKYQSFAFFNPDNKSVIIMMTNSSGRHYNNAFFQALVPNVIDNF